MDIEKVEAKEMKIRERVFALENLILTAILAAGGCGLVNMGLEIMSPHIVLGYLSILAGFMTVIIAACYLAAIARGKLSLARLTANKSPFDS